MTRRTIDFGIDLGTTNSAIACLIDGKPNVLRNNDQSEITPSAVMRRGDQTFVGRSAYEKALLNPELVQTSFKRLMGTDALLSLGGIQMTPEQLSAEVLKALRESAQVRFREPVTAAVVTIPAMFTQSARDATIRASELAGLTQVHLLQEPVAAGLAYGAGGNANAGYVLVYDLGGGTFDACLLSIRSGRLQVVDHAGDEYLGGKELDEVVMAILIEKLRNSFSLPEVLSTADRSRLQYRAERAKIELSRDQTAWVVVDGLSDINGRPINTEIEISRLDYEPRIEPLVARTVEIIADLMARNSLQASTIKLGIAVGGPTHAPYLRQRVEQAIGIRLDASIDPMTVVAQGAALFAGMHFRDQPNGHENVRLGATRVDLRYRPVSESPDAVVGGRIADDPGGVSVEIESTDGGWTSGRIAVTGSTFVTTVRLKEHATTSFRISAFTRDGSLMLLDPEGFSIRHDLVADQAAKLPRALGLAVQKPGSADVWTAVLIPRGAIIPASGRLRVRTTVPIAPSSPAGINFHMVEGEADRADRNDHVGRLRIDGTVIDRPLPKDSEVEIQMSVDERFKISMKLFVPLLDREFQLVVDESVRSVPAIEILEQQLEFEEQRISHSAQAVTTGQATQLLSDVRGGLLAARNSGPDEAVKAQRALRRLQMEVDRVSEAARLPLAQHQWTVLVDEVDALISEYGSPNQVQQFAGIRNDGNDALAAGNQPALSRKIDELTSLRLEIFQEQPGWWIGLYQFLVEQQANLVDQATARLLIHEGRRALDQQDFDALKEKCRGLIRLLPDGQEGLTQALADVKIRV